MFQEVLITRECFDAPGRTLHEPSRTITGPPSQTSKFRRECYTEQSTDAAVYTASPARPHISDCRF
jgi:hypothetical protein